MTRGAKADAWCVERLLACGYAVATFAVADADPDRGDRSDGLHPWFDEAGAPPGSSWGTLRVWAWALSRAVDHLVTEPRLDPQRIVVWGHSRRGKAALLAAAFDERIALVAPHQSGTGGCALSRDNDQETVERITRVFPWWFAETFASFADEVDRLPVDQHLLVALVAPRPLIETVGLEDTWANYESSLRGLRAAAPVWELLGRPGLVGTGVLRPDEAVTAANVGSLVQVRRATPHVMDAGYWDRILAFAEVQWARRSE